MLGSGDLFLVVSSPASFQHENQLIIWDNRRHLIHLKTIRVGHRQRQEL